MKKIVFVDEHKIVNYAGGAEKVICDYANEFTKRGYKASIVCMDMEKGLPLYPLDDEVEFINLCYDERGQRTFGGSIWMIKKFQKEILRAFAGAKMKVAGRKIKDPKKDYYYKTFEDRLRELIDREKPDLMISISTDGAGIIQRAKGKYHIPIIAMCHTDPVHFLSELTKEQWEYWRRCDFVQVLLPIFADKLKAEGLHNLIVIPNCVEEVEENKICDLEKTHHRIISVGRIEGDTKRQHLLIEAFSRIAHKYPQWTVHIYGAIGNKRYAKKLQGLIKKYDLTERVYFEGVTDDVSKCLRESDIFVFPSKYEGFSLALAEAMSVGLPVLGCKDCLSVSDIVTHGENGLLALPNADDIAEKLQLLIDDKPMRIELGRQAHAIMKNYCKSKIYDRWECLINKVI